jgi:hypothetical protein
MQAKKAMIMYGLIPAVSIKIAALSSPKRLIPCSTGIRKQTYVWRTWQMCLKVMRLLKQAVGSIEDGEGSAFIVNLALTDPGRYKS